jgi:hypothetical protein
MSTATACDYYSAVLEEFSPSGAFFSSCCSTGCFSSSFEDSFFESAVDA